MDAREQWFKACSGLNVDGTPREHAFCNWTILSDKIFVVEDAAASPLFRDNPLVSGSPHIRFYAGAPLSLEPGLRLGALCVIDTKPRSFGEKDRQRLSDLAALVVSQLRLHQHAVDNAKQARVLWRLANQDPLTGIANRSSFHQRLEQALAQGRKQDTNVSVLLIDLDNFKDVNDSLGHEVGDALLASVASRLGEFTRDCDTLARIGGDEFALILTAPFEPENARSIAPHIIARLHEPVAFGTASISCRASIGIASSQLGHDDPTELLKDADLALYRAKGSGRNRAVCYAPEMRETTKNRIALRSDVANALKEGQILPYYQPRICLGSGKIIGFEALARWQHPARGLLTPSAFGAVFEDVEIAADIGRSVLAQVAADARVWLDQGLDFGRIAVNFSSAEFANPQLAEEVLAVLNEAGVPAGNFEVEVTETVLLGRDLEQIENALKSLHEAGLTIALDDFGTGFASLTHLKRFPVDHIKIDQSFVRDLRTNRDSAAIVAAVVGLGKSLAIAVTAEGVETAEDAELLQKLGCDHAQGYFYAKPMPASRVAWMLRNWPEPCLETKPNRLYA
jgi:diguanylate cyclase (GGDEF)-like protein